MGMAWYDMIGNWRIPVPTFYVRPRIASQWNFRNVSWMLVSGIALSYPFTHPVVFLL